MTIQQSFDAKTATEFNLESISLAETSELLADFRRLDDKYGTEPEVAAQLAKERAELAKLMGIR